MGKIILLLLPILFIGCDKTFDNLIETNQNKYQVTSASTTPVDSFKYTPNDSLITININFTSSSEVSEVFCDIFASDESKLNSSPFQLFDNNDNRFENDFPLSEFYPIGIYNITYYIKNPDASMQQIARGSFYYDNGQPNLPPEIANTVVEPDTVVVTEPILIFTSVEASDPNGQNDILKVYFTVYNPDSTTSGSEIELFDDGEVDANGDLLAGDGIYSRLIEVDETNTKGTYRFEFRARDRGGNLSNKIDHFVLIQ
jgi:hypothetical protein